MLPALLLAAVFVTTWGLTAAFIRYALARRLVDEPNARSSHSVPTPRGGGMAIVLTVTAALPIVVRFGGLSLRHAIGIAAGGLTTALVGFVDDHRSVKPSWRLAGHFLAAGWLVWCGLATPALRFFGVSLPGWLTVSLTVLCVVWLINLTNFMDGIDGLAAVEVATSCVWAACFSRIGAPGSAVWLAPTVLGSAALGFLCLNWPPARVFLGDGGSGFLGFMLAALALQTSLTQPRLVWSWAIVLGVFVVDASVTLLRRVLSRQRVHEAHRTHAYQYAAARYGSHLVVMLAAGAMTAFWLGPIGLLVSRGTLSGDIALVIAYAPLVVLAFWFGAGKAHDRIHTPEGPVALSANDRFADH